MNGFCGLCFHFHYIPEKKTRYFFSQAVQEANCALFKYCAGSGLIHESFEACDFFEPSKTFYCARYGCIINTESCINKQIREMDESCENCMQGHLIIETMRGRTCSELK